MTPLIEAIKNWRKPLEACEGGVRRTSAVWALDQGFIGLPIGNETTKAIGNFVDDKLIEYSMQRGLDPVPNKFWALVNQEQQDDSRVMTEVGGINVQALNDRASQGGVVEGFVGDDSVGTQGLYYPAEVHPDTPMVYDNSLIDDHVASQGEVPANGIRFVDVPEPHDIADNEPSERPHTVRDYFQRQPPHRWIETPFLNDRQMVIRLMKPDTAEGSETGTPSAYVTNYEIDYRALTITARVVIAPQGQTIQQDQWFDLCTPNDVCEPATLEEKVKKVIWDNMQVGIVGRFKMGKVSSSEAIALETLRGMVGRMEFRRYLKDGFLVVTGASGLRYQIFRDNWHTKVWDGGNVVEEICVRILDEVPPTDNVIAFKCMIECDEDEFRQIGNVYNMRKVA